MIGAIALDGFRGLMTINSGTSNDVFLAFVEQVLAPNLRHGDLVVMDNLAAHKNRRAAEAIRAVGAEVLFLPPYSPTSTRSRKPGPSSRTSCVGYRP
jgi:transposase